MIGSSIWRRRSVASQLGEAWPGLTVFSYDKLVFRIVLVCAEMDEVYLT